MRKVINGKAYDTESATEVHCWQNTADTEDFNYVREEIFRTSKAIFFLVGGGGCKSKYAERISGSVYGSTNVFTVLDDVEARTWLENP